MAWVIDLGPDASTASRPSSPAPAGGPEGCSGVGAIVAEGSPEDIAQVGQSDTGKFLLS
ncbi:MAG: hypothetical protein ACRDZO_25450 [Egibacteraceae bacterium]